MFLLNPDVTKNLLTQHFVVHFTVDYERGRWSKRQARTELPTRIPPQGPPQALEVSLFWTGNTSGSGLVRANVPVRFLRIASPVGKGREVVVLAGLHQGKIVDVVKVSKKERHVRVMLKYQANIPPWDEPLDNVCLVELPSSAY